MSSDLEAARKKLTERVMGRPGVAGTAAGERGGKACLLVYVSDGEGERGLPRSVNGFRVVVERTGRFGAL